MTQLNKLSGPRKVYQAKDKGYFNVKGYPVSRDQATALLNKNGRWAEEVTLAVGAQVMLVTNWKDTGLVNGSTGRVMGFVNVAEATKMGAYVFSDARGVREGSGGCQPKPAADEYWPLVQFAEHRAHSNLPKLVMVPQMTLTVDNADGRLEASRTQVPLILAW